MHDCYDPVKYTLKPLRENTTNPNDDMDKNGRYLGLGRNATEVNDYYVLTQ